MSNTPDKDQFDSAETLALSVMTRRFPDLCTRAGSAIRELVVRPMALLYATWMASIEDAWRRRSPSTLLKSSLTENADADEVASYYGVTRLQGSKARGTVLLRLSRPSLHIPAGTRMTADGVSLVVPSAVTISSGDGASTATVTHVRAIASGSEYLACVGVESVDYGAVELSAGTEVSHSLPSAYILEAVLSSPVTGGSDTETDASLMSRALRTLDGAGAGTAHGIRRLLDLCPTPVTGLSVLGQGDVGSTAQENPVAIGVSGIVDCFIRTQSQAEEAQVTLATSASGTGEKAIRLPADESAGAYTVSGLIIAGEHVPRFTVAFSGTRLGADQEILVTVPDSTFESAQEATITLSRMPGVRAVQEWLDRPGNLFVGQRDIARAAVPVRIGLSCMADAMPDDTTLDLVRDAIASYVNSMEVGSGELNFSDIRAAVEEATDVSLGLPCTITASMPTKSGGMVGLTSSTGVLRIDSDGLSDRWPASVCFFSFAPGSLNLEVRS